MKPKLWTPEALVSVGFLTLLAGIGVSNFQSEEGLAADTARVRTNLAEGGAVGSSAQGVPFIPASVSAGDLRRWAREGELQNDEALARLVRLEAELEQGLRNDESGARKLEAERSKGYLAHGSTVAFSEN